MQHPEHDSELEREREAQRNRCNQEELVARMARAIPKNGRLDPLPGLRIARLCAPTRPFHMGVVPSLCVVAQGSKEAILGGKSYVYDPYKYLLTTVEVPITIRVVEASQERPYLGFRLNLDPALVGSVMVEIGQVALRGVDDSPDAKAMTVSPMNDTLLDAAVRLIRLLDSPTEARLLLPSVTREIVYRLLVGEQGARLREMTLMGGHTHRIAQTVEKICRELNQPLHVEALARGIGMSVSGFHHHFKTVTAMSPLQFQKQLRLQEARRLMLGERLDAATAGFRVGYEDASHFSRDYKRLFGEPPQRDVERLREVAVVGADA